jgi:hypothetical protein
VYGDGVNIASRIEPLADAGGICVSMDVERQIRNAVETRFEKLAPTELKNISVAMDLFHTVLPWEHRADVRSEIRRSEGRKSEIRKSSGVPKRNAALVGAFLLLLIIGIGGWWTTLPRKTGTPRQSEAATVIPEKSLQSEPVLFGRIFSFSRSFQARQSRSPAAFIACNALSRACSRAFDNRSCRSGYRSCHSFNVTPIPAITQPLWIGMPSPIAAHSRLALSSLNLVGRPTWRTSLEGVVSLICPLLVKRCRTVFSTL